MKEYLIGLDNGGTNIKAVIFDLNGRQISHASIKAEVMTPKPGFAEEDMELIWQNNCECVKRALIKSGIKNDQVAGLAISGHGKGLYVWGGDNKCIYNGISSIDNRAWKYPAKWKKEGLFDRYYENLCQDLIPSQQLSLLAWLKDNEFDIYSKIRWIFSVKDYVRFRMTCEAYSEISDISGSGLLNVRTQTFDKTMLDDFGIGEIFHCLPPLRLSSEQCGSLTKSASELMGLPEGLPVAGGMFDIDACAIAMKVVDSQDLITIAGTWSINEYISKEPIINRSNILMNSLYVIPGYYLIEECSATSAGNLEWYIDNLLKKLDFKGFSNAYQYIEAKIQTTKTEDSEVYFLPFLYASNTHPLGKGAFIGITSFHGEADLLRAIYEGVVFSHKHHIERLLETRDKPTVIRLAGGVTKSQYWSQMFADILDYPIELVRDKELGALGAAMAAGVSVGIFRDYYDASQKMTSINHVIEPDPIMHEKYQKKYEKYISICEAMNSIWDYFDH